MSDLNSLNLAEARDGLKKKDFSAVELADAHLAAMEKARALNAFGMETPERASAMAKASDARSARSPRSMKALRARFAARLVTGAT